MVGAYYGLVVPKSRSFSYILPKIGLFTQQPCWFTIAGLQIFLFGDELKDVIWFIRTLMTICLQQYFVS
jgi:hypothetical protein